MHQQIRITTGARLHFGFLADPQSARRTCGGLGLTIDQPRYRLTLRRAAERSSTTEIRDEVTAFDGANISPAEMQRIAHWIDLYRRSLESPMASCECLVEETIPAHHGLGSGTQGALAVAQGLAFLTGAHGESIEQLARRVGRGARSAIGIHGFQQGGLLVDGGKSNRDAIGTLLIREEIPHDWRFLLVTPPDREGFSGREELHAFSRLSPMPLSLTEQLCRLVLLEIVPAVQEADAARFGEALTEYGRAVGSYFSPIQGGAFADPQMSQLADDLHREGVAGIAQSSWGPTICVVCPHDDDARKLRQRIHTDQRYANCHLQIARGLNSGAVVEFIDS